MNSLSACGGLLPPTARLTIEEIAITQDTATIVLRTNEMAAACPRCGQESHRIHSRYRRKLADLPWQGKSVAIHLHARRFFCTVASCDQKIFVERLPDVAKAYARTTCRLSQAHGQIGLALGGEAGARLAQQLAMPTSPDTLLRRVKHYPGEPAPTPRILGIDDWAWKKGHRYGTILIDLERQRVVDLLPDREADTLARWLKEHPAVSIISRDRSGAYAAGARQGAPDAVQVADRWHLLVNVREALERFLDRKPSQRQAAAEQVAARNASSPQPISEPPCNPADAEKDNPRERVRQTCRQQRVDRYERAVALHRRGIGVRQIARELKMGRRTVRRFLQSPVFPERAARRRVSGKLDGFAQFLHQRWDEGCHNAAQLHRELRQRGRPCSYATVQRCLERLGCARTRLQRHKARRRAATKPPAPSPRRVSFWLLRPAPDLDDAARQFTEHLCQQDAEIPVAVGQARDFCTLVRQRRSEALSDWLTQGERSKIPEIRNLAIRLRQDEAAVRAALELPWSTGPVEGHVNRLKAIKRQMYGRAKFDLLRQRVLHAS